MIVVRCVVRCGNFDRLRVSRFVWVSFQVVEVDPLRRSPFHHS